MACHMLPPERTHALQSGCSVVQVVRSNCSQTRAPACCATWYHRSIHQSKFTTPEVDPLCVHMTRQHLLPDATDPAPDMRGIPAPSAATATEAQQAFLSVKGCRPAADTQL